MRRLLLLLACLFVTVPVFAQNAILDDLKAERAQYGTPMTRAQLGAMLNAVALKHKAEGVGLERKDGGDNCPQPVTNIPVACDILRFPGNVGRDVLGDSDGAAVPQWGSPGPANPATFVMPVETGSVPPPSQPPPTTTEVATADLQRQQLTALLEIIQQLQQQLQAQQTQSEILAAAIKDLKAQIAAGVKIRF